MLRHGHALLIPSLAAALMLLPQWPSRAHPPAVLSAEQEKIFGAEVHHFRKLMEEAIVARNAKGLRAMYSDGFTHTHPGGNIDGKDARIASALAGQPLIETAPAEELVVRVPGGWTAIVTGVSAIPTTNGKADGKLERVRWIAVYVRMGESWQLAASQATRVETGR